MAKKLKDTYIHTHRQTYRLPLVVLSAALQQKIIGKLHLCSFEAYNETKKLKIWTRKIKSERDR